MEAMASLKFQACTCSTCACMWNMAFVYTWRAPGVCPRRWGAVGAMHPKGAIKTKCSMPQSFHLVPAIWNPLWECRPEVQISHCKWKHCSFFLTSGCGWFQNGQNNTVKLKIMCAGAWGTNDVISFHRNRNHPLLFDQKLRHGVVLVYPGIPGSVSPCMMLACTWGDISYFILLGK